MNPTPKSPVSVPQPSAPASFDLLTTLQGPRIRLRPLQADDGPALLRAAADGELWQLPFTVVPSADTVHTYLAEALAGRLSAALAQRLGGSVHWQLIAKTGHTTADALAEFEASAAQAADVLVTALGVNDVVSQVSPRRWAHQLQRLHELAVRRAGVRYSLHSAVPPMHAFPLLPQPLRWLLGAHALRMNRMLARSLAGQAQRGLQALPAHLHGSAAAALMAPDGFHPGPAGYQLWAEALAERLVHQITLSSR